MNWLWESYTSEATKLQMLRMNQENHKHWGVGILNLDEGGVDLMASLDAQMAQIQVFVNKHIKL